MLKQTVLFTFAVAAFAVPLQTSISTSNDGSISFEALVERYRPLLNQAPSGNYAGTKDVLGQDINISVQILDDAHMNFGVSGTLSLSCPNETYTYNPPNVNVGLPGDCLEEVLAQDKITLESVVYNAASDSIDIKVKYLILTIEVNLVKVAEIVPARMEKFILPLPVLFDRYYNVFAARAPTGKYYGEKTVLFKTIKATVVILSDSTFSFTGTGPVSFSCASEHFSYSDSGITLPDFNNAGDCLHSQLNSQGMTLKSFAYDSAADQIRVTVNKIVDITLVLSHQGVVMIQ